MTEQNPLLEQIIKQETESEREYSNWECGGLLSVDLVDNDRKGDSLAFILQRQYGIPSAGVEYSIDIGVIKGNETYRRGFQMARGGRRDDVDDFHGWYDEVEINEEREDSIVLTLKSGKAIDTYQLNFNKGYFKRTARRDLEAEEREEEEKEIEEKLKASENFDEYLENLEKKIKHEHEQEEVYAHTGITKLADDLAVIGAGLNQNPYDPVETEVEFYVVKKGQQPEKFVESTGVSGWDRPKFSTTWANLEHGEYREEDDEIIIPVNMTIVQSVGTPERYRRTLNEKSLELRIQSRGEENE